MRRISRIAVAAGLAVAALVSCTSDTEPAQTTRPPLADAINVAVATDLPGIALLKGGENQWTGFDADLWRWLGTHSTPPFRSVEVPAATDERERFLIDGRARLVVNVFSITDDRRTRITLVGPYLITRQGVMVRASDTRIDKASDLDGKRVCVPAGSTSLDQLLEGPLRAQVTIIPEVANSTCVALLLSEQVDAYTTDQLVLHGFSNANPGRLALVPSLVFGPQERYGIGLPPGDIAGCEAITAKLREFLTNGDWEQFFGTHFPNLTPSDFKPDVKRLDPCSLNQTTK